MKRIIDGQTYNTDTATQVFFESADDPSMAWWALYQTRHGAFFKVLVDHDVRIREAPSWMLSKERRDWRWLIRRRWGRLRRVALSMPTASVR